MRNRRIGYGKPPGRHRPGELLDGPPTGAEPEEEAARRRALLFMLEDLDEDRRKIEQARREWTRVFDALRDPVFIHDAQYRVVRANRAYAERAGSGFSGIIGRPYWELFPVRQGPLPHCQVATEDRNDSITEEFTLDSGEIFVSRAFVIRDNEQRFIYAVHVLEDVTEQRRAETERRLLSEALRQSAAGLILLNTDLSFRYANPAACALVGCEPGQLAGLSLAAVVPEGMHERTPVIRAAVDAAGLWTGEITLAARDGTLIPAYLSASTITDANGKTLAYVGSWLDLRPIRQAQEALRLSEEKLREIVEHSTNLFYSHTPEHVLTYVSPQTRQFLDCEPEDALRCWTEFVTDNPVNARGFEMTQRAIDTAQPQPPYELELAGKKGRRVWVEVREAPVVQDGRTVAIVGALSDITERKRAEEALRLSEVRFRALTEHSSDITTIIKPDGTVVFDSPSITRVLGYDPAELVGRNAYELVHPDDRAHTGTALAAVIAAPGTVHTIEQRLRRKDGSWGVFETKGLFLPAVSGIEGVVIVARDISDRKHAEEALRTSESQFRALSENSSDLTTVIGRDGAIRYQSPSNQRLLGYATGELEGRNAFELIHPDDHERTREALARAIAAPGAVQTVEHRLRHMDGGWRVFETKGAFLPDAPGIDGIVINARDVTERKRGEEALRASRDLLQSVVENVPIRVFWKDTESRYLGGNTVFARDAGMTCPEDLLGKDDYQMGWRELADLYRHDDQQVMDSDTPKLGIEEPQTTPDGRTIWLRTSKVPLHGADGNVFGVLGIYEDVTGRKQGEEALRRANRALKTLSACNSVLVHATNEAQLINDMCGMIVDTGGYAYAWIGYAARDADKRIRPMAQAGFEPSVFEQLPLTWADNEAGRSPAGVAIREGAAVVVRDAPNDATLALWRPVLAQLGVGAFSTFPLAQGDDVFGVLAICSREAGAFDREELMLLTELAEDLNFGILTLRARVEHERLLEEHLKTAERLKETLSDTIRAIALTVEKRDPYTAGHQTRVSELSVAIGRELGLEADRLEGLRLGATIHDIGKIYVPAEILNRPGRLSPAEFDMIKSHPEVGYDIVKDIKFPWPVAQMIMQHHEHLDGSGYPKGLKGEDIIFEARILTVADVIEAMSAHRPYRPSRGVEAALAEIEKHRGDWYDSVVADACLQLFREKGFAFSQ